MRSGGCSTRNPPGIDGCSWCYRVTWTICGNPAHRWIPFSRCLIPGWPPMKRRSGITASNPRGVGRNEPGPMLRWGSDERGA